MREGIPRIARWHSYNLVMPHFLISFNDGDMNFPESDLPEVARAAHQVMNDAINAGVWIFGGGFEGYETHVVTSDGSVHQKPLAVSDVHLGGFSIINVATKEEADVWAAKFAVACRCPQEVRQIMDDPEQVSAMAAKRISGN